MMLGKPGASAAPFRILPMPDPAQPASDGPAALLRAIGSAGLRHKGKLAAWVALCLAAAFVYVRITPPTYSATATVLLEPRRQAPSSAREIAAPSSLDLNAADSELQVIRSERLLSTVFDALGLRDYPELALQSPTVSQSLSARVAAALRSALTLGPSQTGSQNSEVQPLVDPRRSAFENFARRFSARRVGQSYVLEISYASADPQLPARVANASASAYLLQSVSFKADAARSGAEFLQGRLDTLATQVRTAEAAVRSGTLPAQPIPDADARIIGAAQTPLGPSAPRASLIMAFAGVFSLLAGLFVAALASVFDRRVRLQQDLVRETGLPCLGIVPEIGGRSGQGRATLSSKSMLVAQGDAESFATAIRDLQSRIEIAWAATRSQGSPVVAIGSWRAGTGATLLTLNLAQLLKHRGRQVSIIGADGAAARAEHGKDGASLTDVIDAGGTLQPVYVPVDGVRLLPIRSAVAQLNRFADFRDARVASVLAHAKQRGEVLIDLPPLGESSDAIALATHADIVVLVAAEGVTTHDELNEALAALRRAGIAVIGAVINRSKR